MTSLQRTKFGKGQGVCQKDIFEQRGTFVNKGTCVNGVYVNEKGTAMNGKGTFVIVNGSSLNVRFT